MPREISTQFEWESLPVGTIVSFDYFATGEGDDDDRTMTVIRVAEPILAVAGQHRLAGGSHWSDMWHYEQGITVLELSPAEQPDLPAFEDALIQAQVAAKNAFYDNQWGEGEVRQAAVRGTIEAVEETAADAMDGDR